MTFADEDARDRAADGEAARQRTRREPPDIVLVDVGTPKLDGYEVSAYIKRTPALEHIPVLLLAGAFEPIDEDKARASGCDGILVKPIEPQQLIGRVRELLAGHRTRATRLREVSTVDATPAAAAPAPVVTPAPLPVPDPLPVPVSGPPPAAVAPPAPLPDLDTIAREFVADPTPVARVSPPSTAPPPPSEPGANTAALRAGARGGASGAAADQSDGIFHRELDEPDAISPRSRRSRAGRRDGVGFARDLNMFRGEPSAAGRAYAWDLPAPPTLSDETPSARKAKPPQAARSPTPPNDWLAPLLPEIVAPAMPAAPPPPVVPSRRS